jgi:hypothetical protein
MPYNRRFILAIICYLERGVAAQSQSDLRFISALRVVLRAGNSRVFRNRSRSHARLEREAFLRAGEGGLPHQATEDILDSCPELEHSEHVRLGAGAQGPSYLDGGTGLATLSEGDSVGATLVSDRLPCGAFGGVERTTRGTLARLLPELSIRDARAGNEFHQRKSELISDESMVGETCGG